MGTCPLLFSSTVKKVVTRFISCEVSKMEKRLFDAVFDSMGECQGANCQH